MTMLTVLLVSWLLLSLPLAVLMGTCIKRGLAPPLDRLPDPPGPVPAGEHARLHVDELGTEHVDVSGAIPAPRLPANDGVPSQSPSWYGQLDALQQAGATSDALRPDAPRDRP